MNDLFHIILPEELLHIIRHSAANEIKINIVQYYKKQGDDKLAFSMVYFPAMHSFSNSTGLTIKEVLAMADELEPVLSATIKSQAFISLLEAMKN